MWSNSSSPPFCKGRLVFFLETNPPLRHGREPCGLRTGGGRLESPSDERGSWMATAHIGLILSFPVCPVKISTSCQRNGFYRDCGGFSWSEKHFFVRGCIRMKTQFWVLLLMYPKTEKVRFGLNGGNEGWGLVLAKRWEEGHGEAIRDAKAHQISLCILKKQPLRGTGRLAGTMNSEKNSVTGFCKSQFGCRGSSLKVTWSWNVQYARFGHSWLQKI